MGKKSNGIGTRDGRSVTGIGYSGHEFLKTIIDGKKYLSVVKYLL